MDVFRTLHLEWSIDQQHRFGYLVPFIGCYLIFLRWEDHPEIKPAEGTVFITLILVAVTVFLFPYRIGKLHNLVDWLSNTPGQEDVITVVSSADNGNGAIAVTVRDNRVFTEETARYMRLRVPVP